MMSVMNEFTGDAPSQSEKKTMSNLHPSARPLTAIRKPSTERLFDDLPVSSEAQTQQTSAGTSVAPSLSNSGSLKRKMVESVEAPAGKKLTPDMFQLRAYVAARKGERADMQDAHVVNEDFAGQIPQLHPSICRVAAYLLCDGHGGARAARHVTENLHSQLSLKFPKGEMAQIEKELKKCSIDSFKKTDEEFLKLARKTKPVWKDGTTVLSVLAVNNTLFIANLGDSKAILCRYNDGLKKVLGIPLTKDHNPVIYEERIRIQKAGGRVIDGRVMGVLEVSRSIGDGPYKNHGVSCIPDMKRCQLSESDRFIILACDGLWKAFNTESAIEFINNILSDEKIEGTETKSAEEVRYETACNRLANEAVRKLSADNVTVILVAISSQR